MSDIHFRPFEKFCAGTGCGYWGKIILEDLAGAAMGVAEGCYRTTSIERPPIYTVMERKPLYLARGINNPTMGVLRCLITGKNIHLKVFPKSLDNPETFFELE